MKISLPSLWKTLFFFAISLVSTFSYAQLNTHYTEILEHQDQVQCSHFKKMLPAAVSAFAGENINIVYHRLNWFIDPSVNYISGSVFTLFKATQPNSQEITFELDSTMIVDSVIYHGNSVGFADSSAYLLNIYLPSVLQLGILDSIQVYYKGTPGQGIGFGSFIQSSHNGTPIIWTLSEPYGAKEWWPCKNDLSDKIDSIDVIVTTPKVNRVASNGVLIDEKDDGTNKTYHWKHRHPIATYLIAVAVTNYDYYSDWAVIGGDSIEVLNYVYPENKVSIMSQTPAVIPSIELFSSKFIDYPFKDEKYGHAQFGWGGGMEHQTMSFMGGFSHSLMAHELAHMWFGDYITCGSWQDIWLNEGFATYLTGLTYENMPTTPYWKNWKSQNISNVISQPGGSVMCDDTTDVNRIFDGRLSYAKGALILHMLRWEIGDSAFFAGVKNYLKNPIIKNAYAKTPQFINIMEQACGHSLQGFFNDWYYNQGYPNYQVTATFNCVDWDINISQTSSHPSVPFFEMDVPIQFKGTNLDTIIRFHNTVNNQSFQVPITPFDTIIFDPQQWLVCTHNLSVFVGISLVDEGKEIIIYPNPTQNELFIDLNEAKVNSLELFSSDGRMVYSEISAGENQKIKIDLTTFETGIYFLRMSTDSNTFVRKIIKN